MTLNELQKSGKVEVIEQQGEYWNLDYLLAMPEAHQDGMAGDDIEEYTLYDADGNEVPHDSIYRARAASTLGSSRTKKKAASSRKNGRMGGRPRILRPIYAIPTGEDYTEKWIHVGTAYTMTEARRKVKEAGFRIMWTGGTHEISPASITGDEIDPYSITVYDQ